MRPIKTKHKPMGCDWLALRELVLPGLETPDIKDPPKARVPNDFVFVGNRDDKAQAPYALGMTLGGLVFSAIHVAGWHLSFLTSIEQELWRIASILMTCLLPIALLPYILIGAMSRPSKPTLISQAWGLLFGFFYIIVRLFLLMETFRTLVYLPPDAFIST
jgi:hypothetical protein